MPARVATVDVLGEFVEDLSQSRETHAEYRRVLGAIDEHGLECNISVKLTALGLLLDEPACEAWVRDLAERARDGRAGFVRVDMEDSPVTQRTLDLVGRLRAQGLPVGAVLQAYLHRTAGDAAGLAEAGVPVRLCKGIYREDESIAFQGRDEIRESYSAALRTLLRGSGPVAVATHDTALVEDAMAAVDELRPGRRDVEFQMLLGVRERLRRRILSEGYAVRVYVPYGPDWYGYSKRRLRENPEIAGHVFRAMFGIGR